MSEITVKLVTQKDFAEMAGVSPSNINRIKKRLGAAVIGRKIDANHASAQSYIAERPIRDERDRRSLTRLNSPKVNPAVNPGNYAYPDAPEETPKVVVPEKLAGLTLQEIVETYGSLNEFSVYVSTQKNLTDYLTKSFKFKDSRDKVVDKSFQGKIIFEMLEVLFDRLVNDVPFSLAQRVVAIVKLNSDDALNEAQKEYSEANSRALRICKDNLIQQLQNAIF